MPAFCCRWRMGRFFFIKKIRGLVLRWARRSLLLLTLVSLLYLLHNNSVYDSPPSRLSPDRRRLALSVMHTETPQAHAGSMLYLNSTITNVACSGLLSRRILNTTQLKTFLDILGPFAYDPRKHSERTSRDKGFCEDLQMKRGFYRWPVTQQEEEFPLAFSFKVHKAPDMFERLLSVLWRPHNFYCIHVDFKAPHDVFSHVENISRCFPNVVLTPTRLDVKYASIVSLQADLDCTKLALKSPVKWKYHVSLCGQEFPLKTNLEMVQLITALNGTNDVENYAPSAYFAALSYKYKSVISNGVNKQTNVSKEPFQHKEVAIRKGSAYNTLSRPFVEWVLSFDQVSHDFLEWLNGTWAPDELFWATLSYRQGAPGGPGMEVRHDTDSVLTKAVNWRWDAYKCRGIFAPYRSSCIFSSLDLPWLLKRHELIANKFDSHLDSTVLDCLELELERRAIAGYLEIRSALITSGSANISGSAGQGSRSSVLSMNASRFAVGSWPVVSSLNWTFYRSLPTFQ
ncbi:beta-1,3-galactosyl-O-glycosyl-glycoprotein beta-1,6-N-acetylglucosaminyltransferase 4-like [Littorina saxatilis]|uniref:Uncharacterized protein n=1 Tax=Littorina saxatilis TaxID=31220 RepID=A0AAN9B433_9CAEN